MKIQRLLSGSLAALALLVISTSCDQELSNTPASGDLKVSILPSVDSYTKATDTAFEIGDCISVFLTYSQDVYNPWVENEKFTHTQSGWKADREITWYEDASKSSIAVAVYPYLSDISLTKVLAQGYSFTVQSDQSTHEKYTSSDLMCGFAENIYPSANPVKIPFTHLLSKVVINITNQTSNVISDVYFGNVYGKVNFNLNNGLNVEGNKAAIKFARVSKADTTSAITYQGIIPPQTTNPSLKITTTDGKIYQYALPNEVDFISGSERKANIVITEDSISVTFDADIDNWTSDSDLNFSQGDQPGQPDEPQKEWESLGWGTYLDSFLNLFGIEEPLEWPVEIEQNTSDPEYFRLVNAYTNEYSPWRELASDQNDHYIYIRLGAYYYGHGRQAYIEHSELGLTIGSYPNICGGSICSENGFGDYNLWGYLASPGYNISGLQTINENTLSFVFEKSHQYMEISGKYYYTCDLFRTVFTFPDKEREKFFDTTWTTERGDGNIQKFVFSTDFDVPSGIKYNLFEGTISNSNSQQLALQMLQGQLESYDMGNAGGYQTFTLEVPINKTAEYTLVLAYPAGDDGTIYYYYQQFAFVLDGEEIPQTQIGSVEATLDPIAPDYGIDVVTQSERPARIGINILPASDVSAFIPLTDEKKTEFTEFVLNQNGFRYLGLSGSSVSEKGTVTRYLTELEPETEYAVICYVQNAYGASDVALTTIKTQACNNDLWKTLPETGEFFDNTANYLSNATDVNGAEVTIEQYGDLPRYRAKAPYQQYWDALGGSSIYNSLPQEDKDIEFWEKEFNYNGTPVEGIYYRPFSNGLHVEGDGEQPRYLIHYARRTVFSNPAGSVKLADKKYQLSGWLECFNGKTASMGYQLDFTAEPYILTLQKGLYSRESSETKALAVRTPFKLVDNEQCCEWKSYLDLLDRVDCSNASIVKASDKNEISELKCSNIIER